MKLTIDGEEIPLNEEDDSCGNKLCVIGGCFCLCTLCLSWVPMCCWCSHMKSKYKNGGEQAPSNNNEAHRNNLDHPQPNNNMYDNEDSAPAANDDDDSGNYGAVQCAAVPAGDDGLF